MTKITIEVTDDQAKMWAFFLRKKYKKSSTQKSFEKNLNKLAKMAILIEVANSAKEILEITKGDLKINEQGFPADENNTTQDLNKKGEN